MKRKLIILVLALATLPFTTWAQSDDTGLRTTIGVEKKLSKKWSIEGEAEFRSRNNFKTADRWSLNVGAAYKVKSWLKLDAGYTLLYDNHKEDITCHDDGSYNHWRPSYWGIRHRLNVSATGRHRIGRIELSLRERWQYTYRPEKTTERYDFDDMQWEDKAVKGKGHSILRSRLQVEYDIPKCKIDPYANVELYNAGALEKTRYTIGADWKIRKKHTVGISYRYQATNDRDDDEEPNYHILGIHYKYKF